MREFLRGWRRRIGVLALVLACAFMGGWVRSYSEDDGFYFAGARLESSAGIIERSLKTAGNSQNGSFQDNTVFWRVPYWSIVFPLTFLSAYLLLRKPHPEKPTGST